MSKFPGYEATRNTCPDGRCGNCPFCSWTESVDVACKEQTGMSRTDWPDVDYRAYHRQGVEAYRMPRIIVDKAFGPGTFDNNFNGEV